MSSNLRELRERCAELRGSRARCAIVFHMAARDTSAKAAAIQNALHSKLGPEGRFRLAMQMSELAREFAQAGVRKRYPGYSDEQISREIVKSLYGR